MIRKLTLILILCLAATFSCGWMTVTMLGGSVGTSAYFISGSGSATLPTAGPTTVYYSISAGSVGHGNIEIKEGIAAAPGILTDFNIELSADIGDDIAPSETAIFTVYVNGIASSPLLQCVITHTAGEDTLCDGGMDTSEVDIAATDTVVLHLITSANPDTGVHFEVFTRFIPDDQNTSLFVFSGVLNTTDTSVAYFPVMGGLTGSQSNRLDASNVIPMSGVGGALHIEISAAPGADVIRTFEVLADGASLSPVVSCTIQDAETECTPDLDEDDIAAGATLTVSSTVSGTGGDAVAANLAGGLKFIANDDLFMIASQTTNTKDDTNNTFYPASCSANCSENATENDRQNITGPITVKAIFVEFETAPDDGAGTQQFDMTLSVDESTTGLTCPIAETATKCNLATDVVVTDMQELSTLFDPTDTPTATGGTMVSYAATVN